MPTIDEQVMAHVRRLEYDPVHHHGILHLAALNCTDMTGCIDFFTRVDPEVSRIDTYNEEGPDTSYVKYAGGHWRATEGRGGRRF